jgi:biotin transport system substrate-specific component
MSQELSLPSIPAAASTATLVTRLRTAAILLAGSALAALCAHIALPLYFTPVPLTLQPFAVLLLGLALTPRMAAATFAVYLLEGALGAPVFAPAPATGGLAHLLGPTGGYLMAYPAAAALISWLWRRTQRGFAAAVLSAAAGDLAILACGALWLAILTRISAQPAFALAIAPFLPGEALKIAAAAALAAGFLRLRRHSASREIKADAPGPASGPRIFP